MLQPLPFGVNAKWLCFTKNVLRSSSYPAFAGKFGTLSNKFHTKFCPKILDCRGSVLLLGENGWYHTNVMLVWHNDAFCSMYSGGEFAEYAPVNLPAFMLNPV